MIKIGDELLSMVAKAFRGFFHYISANVCVIFETFMHKFYHQIQHGFVVLSFS